MTSSTAAPAAQVLASQLALIVARGELEICAHLATDRAAHVMIAANLPAAATWMPGTSQAICSACLHSSAKFANGDLACDLCGSEGTACNMLALPLGALTVFAQVCERCSDPREPSDEIFDAIGREVTGALTNLIAASRGGQT